MSEQHAWSVPHISEVGGRTPADEALFAELASVLEKHRALDRFGVMLLHKHFPIGPDEALLETTDIERREHTLRVIKRSDVNYESSVQTAWKLGPNGEALWGCVCVEIGGSHGGHRPTQ